MGSSLMSGEIRSIMPEYVSNCIRQLARAVDEVDVAVSKKFGLTAIPIYSTIMEE
jgi:hypothetical protein